MFFNGWEGIARVGLMAVVSYITIIVLLRSAGKRTLSKMNVFDFVVTIAVGSMLATIILSKDIALAEGIMGMGVLVLMQFIIAWLSARSKVFRNFVKGRPALLLYNGEILEESARRERVSSPEIYAAIRADGYGDLSEVGAVILETDGSITTLPRGEAPPTTLAYVNKHGVVE